MTVEDLKPAREYRLPTAMREELASPMGPIAVTSGLKALLGNAHPVIAVGDVVSLTLLELGIAPKFFLCDYKTQRGGPVAANPVPLPAHRFRTMLGKWGSKEMETANPAGTITRHAWETIRKAFADPAPAPIRIVVRGEEDLLGLPCVMEAPLGAVVLYGMPSKGVVVVHVTEEARERARGILSRMERL
ncbi:MAG: GTP-dependent dephospho-CoA kinase family protein [Thermoplasmatota archaeon]